MSEPRSLKEYLVQASREGWAVGHFNFGTVEQLMGIVAAAQKTNAPVMVGTSEGERDLLRPKVAAAMVHAIGEELRIPIFLNADHSKRVDRISEALDAGYDSMHLDGSELSFEENVAATKSAVDEVRKQSEIISVEGELGVVGGASEVYKEKRDVRPEDYTKPEEAREFVERTGVDRLAIMVGNIHGISPDESRLDIERIRQIRAAVPREVALVLHAASGIPDEDVRAAIEAGVTNVHVSTEIRMEWKAGLTEALSAAPDEYAPYKLLPPVVTAIEGLVAKKISLFGSSEKA
jgi:ketose-bisphosphate aldolase